MALTVDELNQQLHDIEIRISEDKGAIIAGKTMGVKSLINEAKAQLSIHETRKEQILGLLKKYSEDRYKKEGAGIDNFLKFQKDTNAFSKTNSGISTAGFGGIISMIILVGIGAGIFMSMKKGKLNKIKK